MDANGFGGAAPRTTYVSLLMGAIRPEQALAQTRGVDMRRYLTCDEYRAWLDHARSGFYDGMVTRLAAIERIGASGAHAVEWLVDGYGGNRLAFYGSVPLCAEIDERGRILGRQWHAEMIAKGDRRLEGMQARRERFLNRLEVRTLESQVAGLVGAIENVLDAEGEGAARLDGPLAAQDRPCAIDAADGTPPPSGRPDGCTWELFLAAEDARRRLRAGEGSRAADACRGLVAALGSWDPWASPSFNRASA